MKIINRETMEEYKKHTIEHIEKSQIWYYDQKIPDLVVDDLINNLDIKDNIKNRDIIYSILLKRGINKWLMVRKLLIRLKKFYQKDIINCQNEIGEAKKSENWKRLSNLKEKIKLLYKIRSELKILCQSPRWVIRNQREVGLVDTVGMLKNEANNWYQLYKRLTDHRFLH